MSLSPQWLDELRARVTLSGVISRTTRGDYYKQAQPNFVAHAPIAQIAEMALVDQRQP